MRNEFWFEKTRRITLEIPKSMLSAKVEYAYLDDDGKVHTGIKIIDFDEEGNVQ